nr:MAG TPA: hypothetical protein [Caudoviricetes sp.]
MKAIVSLYPAYIFILFHMLYFEFITLRVEADLV